MRKSEFSEEQIIAIVKEAEAGVDVAVLFKLSTVPTPWPKCCRWAP